MKNSKSILTKLLYGTFVPLGATAGNPNAANSSIGNIFANSCSGNDCLTTLLNNSFKAAITVGAVLAVLRIAWAGYLYMASDIWSTKGEAREILQNAVIGLLILLSIYLVLAQINPQLLNLNLLTSLQKIQSTSGSAAP